tara:strand:- start:41184 stop:42242 length:1059 start_codon:yes stop_codon:yes gene_type:complete
MGATLPKQLKELLHSGLVIPAHPTALTENLQLDERRQRALSRYYLDAGSGGLAIGVHTSQFEIRDIGLYKPILELGKEEIETYTQTNNKEIFRIAGVLGNTKQAVAEATIAVNLGYHGVLLSLSALNGRSNEKLIEHSKAVAEIIPVIGFYAQSSIGGEMLDANFWCEFSRIQNVVGIKMAPFDRYKTLDVIRGVANSGRADEIALYTGNDDNIVPDLLTNYHLPTEKGVIQKKIIGGLLGHWAVWNKKAVELFERIKHANSSETCNLLSFGIKVTDSNAAFFDSRNSFRGSIAGIHEVLIRQGLLKANYTINPKERLSAGQKKEIDRVYTIYPELNDDEFVAQNKDRWLRN